MSKRVDNDFVKVWIPSGVLTLPKKSIKTLFEICVLGSYDRINQIQSHDIVVDVGAHVGIFTLLSAKKAKKGLVIAIEPDPLNFKLLLKNIKQNQLKNVIPFNIALADYNDWGKLYISQKTDGLGHTINPNISKQKGLDRFINVKVRALDSLIRELDIKKIHFIKIDVEGGELEVLAGAKEVLKTNKDVKVAIGSYHYPEESKEIIKILTSNGLKTFFEDNYIGYLSGIGRCTCVYGQF